MSDLAYAFFIIGLAVGIVLGAATVYSAWQAENRVRDRQRESLFRRLGACELENMDLRERLAEASPRGLTPVYDGIVIDLFRRDLDSLDERSEQWGPA